MAHGFVQLVDGGGLHHGQEAFKSQVGSCGGGVSQGEAVTLSRTSGDDRAMVRHDYFQFMDPAPFDFDLLLPDFGLFPLAPEFIMGRLFGREPFDVEILVVGLRMGDTPGDLGVVAEKKGMKEGWCWRLPKHSQPEGRQGTPKNTVPGDWQPSHSSGGFGSLRGDDSVPVKDDELSPSSKIATTDNLFTEVEL